jgi:hypothetical protein
MASKGSDIKISAQRAASSLPSGLNGISVLPWIRFSLFHGVLAWRINPSLII